MSLTDVKRAVNRFLQSPEPNAVALTGKWGTGKTYFWNSLIHEHASSANTNYTYVSLFGMCSLAEVKEALFENTIPAAQMTEEGNARLNLESDTKDHNEDEPKPRRGKVSKALGTGITAVRKVFPFLSEISKFGPLARSAAFLTIRRHIICFDDLERRSNALPLKDLFGLISFLIEQRQCKVMAILNTDALTDADREQYHALREKTFYYEIRYQPNAADRGGPISLDRMFSSLSGALRWSAYAAVCRVGRLSKYTPSGV